MAPKKNNGSSEKNNDPVFNFFDLNKDGKIDIWEDFYAIDYIEDMHKSFKKKQGKESNNIHGHTVSYDEFDNTTEKPEDKYEWRQHAKDGSEYCLDPEDYETEKEYNIALEEARHEWRDTAEKGWQYGINPWQYETEEEYKAAIKKYSWRCYAEDGKLYGLSPMNFETEMIMDAVAEKLKNTTPRSRRYDVLSDILQKNGFDGVSEKRAYFLKNLLKDYKTMSGNLRQALMDLGFKITEDGKHYRLTYYGDDRYKTTVSKTASDYREGKNMASTIIKNMF